MVGDLVTRLVSCAMVIQIFFFFWGYFLLLRVITLPIDLLVLLAHEELLAGGQVFKIGLA